MKYMEEIGDRGSRRTGIKRKWKVAVKLCFGEASSPLDPLEKHIQEPSRCGSGVLAGSEGIFVQNCNYKSRFNRSDTSHLHSS